MNASPPVATERDLQIMWFLRRGLPIDTVARGMGLDPDDVTRVFRRLANQPAVVFKPAIEGMMERERAFLPRRRAEELLPEVTTPALRARIRKLYGVAR